MKRAAKDVKGPTKKYKAIRRFNEYCWASARMRSISGGFACRTTNWNPTWAHNNPKALSQYAARPVPCNISLRLMPLKSASKTDVLISSQGKRNNKTETGGMFCFHWFCKMNFNRKIENTDSKGLLENAPTAAVRSKNAFNEPRGTLAGTEVLESSLTERI